MEWWTCVGIAHLDVIGKFKRDYGTCQFSNRHSLDPDHNCKLQTAGRTSEHKARVKRSSESSLVWWFTWPLYLL
jgi:hypothetical protein